MAWPSDRRWIEHHIEVQNTDSLADFLAKGTCLKLVDLDRLLRTLEGRDLQNRGLLYGITPSHSKALTFEVDSMIFGNPNGLNGR